MKKAFAILSTGHLQESERCSLFSQSPGLSPSCWRCWVVCCYGWDAANGSAAACRRAQCFTGIPESGRRRSDRCAAAATDWWGRPDYLVQTRDGGKSFVVPVGGQESRPPGPALRQPHPAAGDLLSARRRKLRSCAPLRPAALRRRHAAHRLHRRTAPPRA